MTSLQECKAMVNNSQMLIKNWVFIEVVSDTPDKKKLQNMHEVQFPKLQNELLTISKNWTEEEQAMLNVILTGINDTLFRDHKEIMHALREFSDYEDLMVAWEIKPMVEDGGQVIDETNRILAEIEELTEIISSKTEDAMMLNGFFEIYN